MSATHNSERNAEPLPGNRICTALVQTYGPTAVCAFDLVDDGWRCRYCAEPPITAADNARMAAQLGIKDYKSSPVESLPAQLKVPTVEEFNVAMQECGMPASMVKFGVDKFKITVHTPVNKSVVQPWVSTIPMMMQSVLFTAIRGPDTLPKYSAAKPLQRWFRRCILRCSFGGNVFTDPYTEGGGSFTGPSLRNPHCVVNGNWEEAIKYLVDDYMRALDEMPHHFQLHFMHAAEIVGYFHPDPRIASWWSMLYHRLVDDMHLMPETKEMLSARLSDTREGWLARADAATVE